MDYNEGYDFAGWVTKNDVRCSDGKIIAHNAFIAQDGTRVPLVWMHQYGGIENVLGNVLLQNRPEGVYGYGSLNESESADMARVILKHNDVTAMSIYANKLTCKGDEVVNGVIREVSLVLAGANPGAVIDDVVIHGENSDEAVLFIDAEDNMLRHSETGDIDFEPVDDSIVHSVNDKEESVNNEKNAPSATSASGKSGAQSDDQTVADVVETMNEDQKTALYYLIGQALDGKIGSENEENEENTDDKEDDVKHNVFDNDTQSNSDVLVHDAMMSIIDTAKQGYSMKRIFNDFVESSDEGEAIVHAATYGVDPVDYLFPDPKTMNNTPEFIKRDTGWVPVFLNSVHHTPFSRIKSMFADITEDDARARGYFKGNLKKDEVFTLLKRTTTPTTIYKRQKMDRDDIVDITDFDVVAWLKGEMRMMLDEEIARACLVGDGRPTSSDDKISEQNIRPIWTDDDLYTIKAVVTEQTDADETAKQFIRTAIKARKDYKGSGNPTLFTTEDFLTDMLLLEDKLGHPLYESVEKLATKLRVSKIQTVEVMENLTRHDSTDSKDHTLMGIIVNPADYNIGADRGGAVSMFDDFDIDYNQQKYLIETRCSGALIKPFSAIAIESVPND